MSWSCPFLRDRVGRFFAGRSWQIDLDRNVAKLDAWWVKKLVVDSIEQLQIVCDDVRLL